MQIFNNTNNEVEYTISTSSADNCGTINAGGTAEEPSFDNTNNVTVAFSTINETPFSVTIPETKSGMVVTVGIYFE